MDIGGSHGNYSSGVDASTSNDSSATDEFLETCDLTEYEPHRIVMRNLWMYCGYPILGVGTVGHVLVVAILLGNRGMRALSLSTFLMTMSLAGLVALYVGLLNTIVEQHTCEHVMFKSRTTETGCRLHVASTYFALHLYSWMEVCVAVERAAAVQWPHRYRTLFTRRNNAIVVLVVVTVLLGLNSIPFVAHGYDENSFCAATDRELFEHTWRYIHCVVYAALPVAIMLPSNALILKVMSDKRFSASSNVRKAKPITIMMVTMNAIFMVTVVPILVGDWSQLEKSKYFAVEVIWCVCRLLMYLGSAVTFLVYLAVGAKFRKALKELMRSGKHGLERALSVISGGAYQPHVTQGRGAYRGAPAAASNSEPTLEEKL